MKIETDVFGITNLLKAYELIKEELKKTDYPLDPIYYPLINLIDQDRDGFFEKLTIYLCNFNYEADKAYYVHIPKNEVRYRKVGVLSLIDRVVFQAIMNFGYMGTIFNSSINDNICFTPKVAVTGTSYFQYYQKTYDKFIHKQIQSFYEGYKWHITFDLERFFDTIPQNALVEKLEATCPGVGIKILKTLGEMLKKWDNTGFGIPQGPFASQALSNFYLFDTDAYANKLMKQNDFVLVRYQDDFALMARDEYTAKKVYELVAEQLMAVGLSLNHKAQIAILENAEDLYDSMICPSENDTPEDTTFEKIVKYRKEIPLITSKINDREKLTEKDLRILKYYLKVLLPLPFREAYLEDFVSIVDKMPNFSLYIVRYIEFNLRYNPNSYINLDERLKIVLTNKHMPWWGRFWIYKTILTHKYPKNREYVLEFIEKEETDEWLIDTITYQERRLHEIDTAKLGNGINPYIFGIFAYRLLSLEDIVDYENIVLRIFNIANKDLQVLGYYLCLKNKLEIPYHILEFISVLQGREIQETQVKNTNTKVLNVDILNVREVRVGAFYGLDKQPIKVNVDEKYLTYSNVLGKALQFPHVIINDEQHEVCFIHNEMEVLTKSNLTMDSEWISFLRLFSGKKKQESIGSPADMSRKVPKKAGTIETKFTNQSKLYHQKRFLNRKDDINEKFNFDGSFLLFSKNGIGDWVCNATVTEITIK